MLGKKNNNNTQNAHLSGKARDGLRRYRGSGHPFEMATRRKFGDRNHKDGNRYRLDFGRQQFELLDDAKNDRPAASSNVEEHFHIFIIFDNKNAY